MATDKLSDLAGIRIITKKQLSKLIPYSMPHVKRLEDQGKFPRRVQLGENRVGWVLGEVETWIRTKMAERPIGQKSVEIPS